MHWLIPWSIACLAAGCRFGFDAAAPVGDDAILPDGPANYVFVTSQPVFVGRLGSLAAADAACNQFAAGHLPGRYVAWLSTSTTNAIDRIPGARGWVRPDGRPFADTAADIANGRIWYPPSLDENGVASSRTVATTSDAHGRFAGSSCSDLTDDSMNASCDLGESSGTATFSRYPLLAGLCLLSEPIYCFAVDRNVRVQAPMPRTGVQLFPAEGYRPSGGIAGADALCAQAAVTGGATGTFRALLATSTIAPGSRFDLAAGPVVRPDGIEIAASVGDLLGGSLASAPNVTLDGRYLSGPVWAGTLDAMKPSTTTPCGDWTTSNAGELAAVGELGSAQVGFFGLSSFRVGRSQPCNTRQPIYCLED